METRKIPRFGGLAQMKMDIYESWVFFREFLTWQIFIEPSQLDPNEKWLCLAVAIKHPSFVMYAYFRSEMSVSIAKRTLICDVGLSVRPSMKCRETSLTINQM